MKSIHSITINELGTAMILFEKPTKGCSAHQIEISSGRLIVDAGPDGRTIGVEILDPKIAKRLFFPLVRKLIKTYKIRRDYRKSLDIKR